MAYFKIQPYKEDQKDLIYRIAHTKEMGLTEIVNKINEKFDQKNSVQNLNNKLIRGSLRDYEIAQICDVCGYDLIITNKVVDDDKSMMVADSPNFDTVLFIGEDSAIAYNQYLESIRDIDHQSREYEIALLHRIQKKFKVITQTYSFDF